MAKIFGWKKGNWQPDPANPRYVVDCPLYDMNTTPDVFWSENKNSYCLVRVPYLGGQPREPEYLDRYSWLSPTGEWFQLYSINGAGEVRWDVSKHRVQYMLEMEEKYGDEIGDSKEFLAALRHFGLAPKRCPKCKSLDTMFNKMCLNITCDYREE